MAFPTDMSVSDTNAIVPPSTLGDLEREEALAKRFARKNIFQEDIVFEFTRDPAFLKQYYRIREQEFKHILGAQNYSGEETVYDRRGQILIIRQGNYCIGGARIDLKTPKHTELLPIERYGFRLTDHFPQLEYKQVSYGQLSNLSVLPEYHGLNMSRRISENLVRKARAFNLSVLFSMSPMLNARLYRQDFIAMGLKETKIHLDIELPTYAGLEDVKLHLVSSVIDEKMVDILENVKKTPSSYHTDSAAAEQEINHLQEA